MVDDDDGRTPDHAGHPISSPCEPYGSGELTKRSNIVYPILPCIRHYIKVGCNGIYVKANVQLSCKLT